MADPVRFFLVALFMPVVGFSMTGCGTNTKEPVYPILTVLSPISTPSIVSVVPISEQTADDGDLDLKVEFDVSYYITNKESEFIGYNIYISRVENSPDSPGGVLYLPDGIEPSFSHVDEPVDTSSAGLITQRVTHYKAPPGEIPFLLCEPYYFSMNAISNNGTNSHRSVRKRACATTRPDLCPVDSPCYQKPITSKNEPEE